ncbi:L,D-transpeptidase [Dietzia sp. SL131]|uniref:L,D-transpeptidase n=1 Tax=Dietzia sp. SL131 TaxID=2995149 RepID=UPI00227A6A75|nr:L,D-transpeptidase [Dietzia sp. SL131]MCY1658337.1 L,D-transpeptidase [Dietzia sp. SL131]
MSRRTRSFATLLATACLVVVGLSPAASAQSLLGPTGSTGSVGALGLESAPLPAVGGSTGVLTLPVPAVGRTTAETGVASVYPTSGETVGVAQPVMIRFDQPVADRARAEASVGIRTAPAVDGKFYWVGDSELRWRPHEFWPAGTSVTVWAGGRETVFRTGDAVISTYDDATHTVTVTRNGQVVRTMKASAGRDAYATHNGVYYNGWRAREVRMDSETWGLSRTAGGYDTIVENGVRLSYDGIFIHSAPWSVADQGVRNVSHGCINVSPEDAAWYFDNTRNGDPFIVVNGPGRPFGAFDGQGDWNY